MWWKHAWDDKCSGAWQRIHTFKKRRTNMDSFTKCITARWDIMMHNNIGFIKYNNNTTYYITYDTINLILPDNDQMKTSGYFSDLRITFAFGHYLNWIWKDFLVLIKLGRTGIRLYLAQGLRGNAAMPCHPGPTSRYFYSRCSPIIPKCCGNLYYIINEKDFESEWKPQLCIWKPSQRAACSSVALNVL